MATIVHPKDFSVDDVFLFLFALGYSDIAYAFRAYEVYGGLLVQLDQDDYCERFNISSSQSIHIKHSVETLSNFAEAGGVARIRALENEAAESVARISDIQEELNVSMNRIIELEDENVALRTRQYATSNSTLSATTSSPIPPAKTVARIFDMQDELNVSMNRIIELEDENAALRARQNAISNSTLSATTSNSIPPAESIARISDMQAELNVSMNRIIELEDENAALHARQNAASNSTLSVTTSSSIPPAVEPTQPMNPLQFVIKTVTNIVLSELTHYFGLTLAREILELLVGLRKLNWKHKNRLQITNSAR
jgi:hypothetical protein